MIPIRNVLQHLDAIESSFERSLSVKLVPFVEDSIYLGFLLTSGSTSHLLLLLAIMRFSLVQLRVATWL
jgi:hypothetical protein